MSGAAKQEALEALHAALAASLAESINEKEVKIIELPDDLVLENGTTVVSGSKMITRSRNASILNVARQFLKDNGVESAKLPATPAGKSLVESLPFAGADGETGDAVH